MKGYIIIIIFVLLQGIFCPPLGKWLPFHAESITFRTSQVQFFLMPAHSLTSDKVKTL
jgi:hypothetical protein